jgi:hypothetical protein
MKWLLIYFAIMMAHAVPFAWFCVKHDILIERYLAALLLWPFTDVLLLFHFTTIWEAIMILLTIAVLYTLTDLEDDE